MILFADSSALIKLYLPEPGSDRMLAAAEAAELAISPLAVAELHAAFARRLREGLLMVAEYDRVAVQFEAERELMIDVLPDANLLSRIPALCRSHPLRGADALQLASALALQREGLEVTFAASDRALLTAAAVEGLPTLDPLEE